MKRYLIVCYDLEDNTMYDEETTISCAYGIFEIPNRERGPIYTVKKVVYTSPHFDDIYSDDYCFGSAFVPHVMSNGTIKIKKYSGDKIVRYETEEEIKLYAELNFNNN